MPSVEMLRMTSSGTEATMSAIRLARAATGREKLLKFAGAYHGHVDGLLAQAGSGLATGAIPASPGVTAGRHRGDGDRALERPRGACCAPPRSTSSRRSWPSRSPPTWASSRRPRASSSCCASARRATGALLVFDEVITGFRVARGGAQELAGVLPDLTIMGKVMGGGLPAAAYGGAARADGARRPRRRRLPGGHAVGQSARGRRRPDHAAAARRARLRLPDGAHRDAGRRACARPPATCPCTS